MKGCLPHTWMCCGYIQQKFKGSFWSSPLEVWEVFSYLYTLYFMLCFLFVCLIIPFNHYFNYYHANFTCISIYVSLLLFFLLFYFLMHSVGSIKYHQSWTICFHLVVFMFNHMLMTDHMYAHCLKLTIDIENKDFLWQCIVIKMPSSNPVSQCMYMIFNMLILLNICQIHHLSSCCKDVKHS